jgi:hypothetical protein
LLCAASRKRALRGFEIELASEERAQLASFLLETLEPSDSGDISQTWEAKIAARWAEIERGDVELIPATVVFAEVRRKLA